MNVRHPCLTFIFYQNHFYDKMDLSLLYFHMTYKGQSILSHITCKPRIMRRTKVLPKSTFFSQVFIKGRGIKIIKIQHSPFFPVSNFIESTGKCLTTLI